MRTMDTFFIKKEYLPNTVETDCGHYLTLLFLPAGSEIILADKSSLLAANGLFLLRGCFPFELHTAPLPGGWGVFFDEQLADTLFLSQLMDCPVFYDLLQLAADSPEYLLFLLSPEFALYTNPFRKQLQIQDEYTDKSLRSALVLFLTQLQRHHRQLLLIGESSMMPQYLIGQILKYMSDHYATITLETAAAHFHYTPSYFSQLFYQKAQCHFSQKLLEIRLERARRLLLTTSLRVDEIRAAIGFSEKSYFHRVFKQHFGSTPSAWRKSNRKTDG